MKQAIATARQVERVQLDCIGFHPLREGLKPSSDSAPPDVRRTHSLWPDVRLHPPSESPQRGYPRGGKHNHALRAGRTHPRKSRTLRMDVAQAPPQFATLNDEAVVVLAPDAHLITAVIL